MLLPKEDRDSKQLMYTCRTCQHSEPAQSPCVYRNQLYNTVGETAGVTQDVGADPTVSYCLPHSTPDNSPSTTLFVTCTVCGGEVCCDVCGKSAAAEWNVFFCSEGVFLDELVDEEDAGDLDGVQSSSKKTEEPVVESARAARCSHS